MTSLFSQDENIIVSSNRNFHHFSTSPNHLSFGINRNSEECGESSFGTYCI